jgi:hypothetical protein
MAAVQLSNILSDVNRLQQRNAEYQRHCLQLSGEKELAQKQLTEGGNSAAWQRTPHLGILPHSPPFFHRASPG